MRRLKYSLNPAHLQRIKSQIIPTLFTQHQFELIFKKLKHQKMSPSEKNEFSRTISRKMKAIYALMEKDSAGLFVYGRTKMKKERLAQAIKYLQQFSRKFKNRHVLIGGSFLYGIKYNDIDIFIISKYEKEDVLQGKFHINYLTEDVYNSLFFASLRKLCVSNRELMEAEIKEKIDINTFISLYQELCNDLDRKFAGAEKTLREFLLQAAFLSKYTMPDSQELKQRTTIIMQKKKCPELVKKIFVETIILSIKPSQAVKSMKEMIKSYEEVKQEYPQHQRYYDNLISSFQEVIAFES